MITIFRTATIISNQGVPTDVYDDMRNLWRDYDLGNDYYYFPWDDELDESYPVLAKFIKDKELTGEILIHFYW